ncbi:uncharacterized protein LOC110451890 [Mizuhopecten yessoensis]|uniref:Uncharacterized protein n=1 Tax=Mizuhopecten yessoensis TaxID=6573 RepID=A0A210QKW8_MIZYE|nr:uncharacterized protein LOC110451890 [Mizuhopecten yessoensis]OWF49389.1 hypothetical protein KP79_PYT11814 [Mizuhopecten yessoensis]
MLMDTPAPDVPSSGTGIANQELPSNLAQSQTTSADKGSLSKKTARKAKKKQDKKKFTTDFNKIVKKLVEDGHLAAVGESGVGDLTPRQLNEPESSTIIWSPALARPGNATMGLEDNEHMHDLLHSFLFGRGDDEAGHPLMNLAVNSQLQRIPHRDLSGSDSTHLSEQDLLQRNQTRKLSDHVDNTTVIVDFVQNPEGSNPNDIPSVSVTTPTPPGQDPEGDAFSKAPSGVTPPTTEHTSVDETFPEQDTGGEDDDTHPTANESSMAGIKDSNIKESAMAGSVDSNINESAVAGGVNSSSKVIAVDGIPGEDPEKSITIHIHHPPAVDKNKTRSLKKKWKKKCKRDYYNIPQGRQCCLKAVRCLDQLPDILEEIDDFDDTHTNKLLVCSHVQTSLTCLSTTLKQKQCRNTAKDINAKFKPQLSAITKFFDPKCINTGQETTTLPARGEGQSGSGGGGTHINAAIIGASVGGFILVGVLLLIVLFMKRRKPNRGQSKKTSRDNDVNDKRESSRYKDMEFERVHRKHSDVYAEIDERSMHSFRNPEMNGHLEPEGDRPLPSAPPNGTVPVDHHGYLTPQIRKDSAPVLEEATGGYTVLQDSKDGTVSYTTLRPTETDDDADYISPDEDAASPKRRSVPGSQVSTPQPTPKPRQPSTGDEPYHAYFILEKENVEHV